MTRETASTVPLETLDKERVLHPATSIADHPRAGPRIMAEGSGLTLVDTSGKRYLDAVAGLWCVAIGYGRTEVAEAMAAQSRKLAFYHTFSSMSNEPQIRLADRPLGLVPGNMSKVFFGNSGSEANDTQVSPPLCITRAQVDQIVDGLARAIEHVGDDLTREGAWRTGRS